MISHFTKFALVFGLGLIPLAAQPSSNPDGGAGQGQMMGRMADQLKLTENQKTQIQAIQSRHADATKTKAQAAAETRKAFRDAAQNLDTPPAQLKTLYQAKSDKAFDLLLEHRTTHNEIRTLLTPEQRIEMDKLRAYRQGLMQGRRGKGGHGKS